MPPAREETREETREEAREEAREEKLETNTDHFNQKMILQASFILVASYFFATTILPDEQKQLLQQTWDQNGILSLIGALMFSIPFFFNMRSPNDLTPLQSFQLKNKTEILVQKMKMVRRLSAYNADICNSRFNSITTIHFKIEWGFYS